MLALVNKVLMHPHGQSLQVTCLVAPILKRHVLMVSSTQPLACICSGPLRPLICGEHYPAYDRGVIDYFDRHVLQLVQQSEVTEHFV